VLFPQLWGKCQGTNSQRRGTARTLPHYLLFGLFSCYLCCSVYCLCVNVYCHRVTTQLQLINILYIHISRNVPAITRFSLLHVHFNIEIFIIYPIFYSVSDVMVLSMLDVHESVHRDLIMNTTNEMQLYGLIYYSLSALHVSGDVFVRHQEHLTVYTTSGTIHQCRCRLVSWMNGTQFHLVHDTSRQRHWWILSYAVNTVKCSWLWAKTSPETCRAD
jgi:hypothetical protein